MIYSFNLFLKHFDLLPLNQNTTFSGGHAEQLSLWWDLRTVQRLRAGQWHGTATGLQDCQFL